MAIDGMRGGRTTPHEERAGARIDLVVPPGLKEQVFEAAKRKGTNATDYVIAVLERHFRESG